MDVLEIERIMVQFRPDFKCGVFGEACLEVSIAAGANKIDLDLARES